MVIMTRAQNKGKPLFKILRYEGLLTIIMSFVTGGTVDEDSVSTKNEDYGRSADEIFKTLLCARAVCRQFRSAVRTLHPRGDFLNLVARAWVNPLRNVIITPKPDQAVDPKVNCVAIIRKLGCLCNIMPEAKTQFLSLFEPMSREDWNKLFAPAANRILDKNNLPSALNFVRCFYLLKPEILHGNVFLMILFMLKFRHLMIHTLNTFNFNLNAQANHTLHTVLIEAVYCENLCVVEELVLSVFSKKGLYDIDKTVKCADGHDVFYYLKEVKDENFKREAGKLLNLLHNREDREKAQKKAKKKFYKK